MKISNVHIENQQHAVLLADCCQGDVKHEIFYAVELKNKQYLNAFVLTTSVKTMELAKF